MNVYFNNLLGQPFLKSTSFCLVSLAFFIPPSCELINRIKCKTGNFSMNLFICNVVVFKLNWCSCVRYHFDMPRTESQLFFFT